MAKKNFEKEKKKKKKGGEQNNLAKRKKERHKEGEGKNYIKRKFSGKNNQRKISIKKGKRFKGEGNIICALRGREFLMGEFKKRKKKGGASEGGENGLK